jgi:hypothetical protein
MAVAVCLAVAISGCGELESGMKSGEARSPMSGGTGGGGAVTGGVGGGQAPGGAGGASGIGSGGAGGAGGMIVPPSGGTGGAACMIAPSGGMGGMGGAGSMDAMSGGTGGGGGPLLPSVPEDGDPNGPVVTADGVPCGPNPSLFGLTSTNVTIGGRGVHVAYPCNKHKGAPVVFILNLHGTMPSEELKLYQVAYFSANTLVDSHNFITAAPKAVGSQWGNGDGGVDLPHIMEVIDWVYTTFADFDIRAMWVAGHSWGAMYSTNFACDPAVADKLRGAVLQSGSGMNPACAADISVISSAAEDDIGPVIDQGGVPAGHGCGAPETNMVGNNVETYWPDCSPGFAHANYLMLGKGHSDYMDAVVVQRIGDLIKAARP